jgi:hypothetical protein
VPVELQRRLRNGTIGVVTAEQLIALEAALMELGKLYAVGTSFTALRDQAERELLPALLALGATLRGLHRTARLSAGAIDRASREIIRLRTAWRAALAEVRSAPAYQGALTAWAANDQVALARLIPRIFAGVSLVRPVPPIFFPVSPSSGRRRPGTAPFLSAPACVDHIAHSLSAGIEPDRSGSEWWERELPYLVCADTPSALDTPIALHWAVPNPSLALFALVDEPTYRLFTPGLQAPLNVVLAADATDEWWQAYDESYAAFREALCRELATRGLEVSQA